MESTGEPDKSSFCGGRGVQTLERREREREGERTRGKMCQGKVGLRGSLAFSFFKIVSIPYLYTDGSGLVESEKLMMEPCP